jgi:hypothetical protein
LFKGSSDKGIFGVFIGLLSSRSSVKNNKVPNRAREPKSLVVTLWCVSSRGRYTIIK